VLARSGLTDITGGIVADASRFGGREINPAWDPDDLQYDTRRAERAFAR